MPSHSLLSFRPSPPHHFVVATSFYSTFCTSSPLRPADAPIIVRIDCIEVLPQPLDLRPNVRARLRLSSCPDSLNEGLLPAADWVLELLLGLAAAMSALADAISCCPCLQRTFVRLAGCWLHFPGARGASTVCCPHTAAFSSSKSQGWR